MVKTMDVATYCKIAKTSPASVSKAISAKIDLMGVDKITHYGRLYTLDVDLDRLKLEMKEKARIKRARKKLRAKIEANRKKRVPKNIS